MATRCKVNKEQTGVKFDAGKPRSYLVMSGFSKALTEVSKVGTFGAKKYAANNWKYVDNAIERYSDAMMRHFMEEAAGNSTDEETGLLHAAHAAWNALARLEKLIEEAEENE